MKISITIELDEPNATDDNFNCKIEDITIMDKDSNYTVEDVNSIEGVSKVVARGCEWIIQRFGMNTDEFLEQAHMGEDTFHKLQNEGGDRPNQLGSLLNGLIQMFVHQKKEHELRKMLHQMVDVFLENPHTIADLGLKIGLIVSDAYTKQQKRKKEIQTEKRIKKLEEEEASKLAQKELEELRKEYIKIQQTITEFDSITSIEELYEAIIRIKITVETPLNFELHPVALPMLCPGFLDLFCKMISNHANNFPMQSITPSKVKEFVMQALFETTQKKNAIPETITKEKIEALDNVLTRMKGAETRIDECIQKNIIFTPLIVLKQIIYMLHEQRKWFSMKPHKGLNCT